MILPFDVIDLIAIQLVSYQSLGSLAALSQTSRDVNLIVIPRLYVSLELHDDDDFSALLDTVACHDPYLASALALPPRLSPLRYTKHLIISHFPSPALCKRLRRVHTASSSTHVLLPSIHTLELKRAACHSILWGPLQYLRYPDAVSTHLLPLTAAEIVRSLALLLSPRSICAHLNRYSVLEHEWDRFFALLCRPWRATLNCVSIHGAEYRFKAFLPGVKHRLFLDIHNAPFRPGTGLLLDHASLEERERRLEAWADVLFAILIDAMEREGAEAGKGAQIGATTWEVHCPGARVGEIAEAEELLLRKVRNSITGQMWDTLERMPGPLIHFIMAETVACTVCKGRSHLSSAHSAESAPMTIPRTKIRV